MKLHGVVIGLLSMVIAGAAIAENPLPIESRFLSLYNYYHPIRLELAAWVGHQDERVRKNTQVGAKLNGLWQSYQSSSSYCSKDLAGYSRIWMYDAALGLYSVLIQDDHTRGAQAVENLMELLRAEKKRGYRGLFHFSYNAVGDSYIDPREPQGATQWVLKSLYAYMLETGDVRYFGELTTRVREDIFPLQILQTNHPAFGLLRQGYAHPEGTGQGGYGIYGNLTELNQVHHGVNLEHNADYIDMLRLLTHVLDRHPELTALIKDNFRNELQTRHALCMQALLRVRKGDYWPTGFDVKGEVNESRAVDHYTWLAHTFLGVKDNRDIPWKSLQIFSREFTVTIDSLAVLESTQEVRVPLSKPATGLFFFQRDYEDEHVRIPPAYRGKLQQMIQPEATAGGVCFLIDLIRQSQDSTRREEAFQWLTKYLYGLAEIHSTLKTVKGYEGGGMPYATEFIPDYFGPHPSMAAVASYLIALNNLEHEYPYFLGVPPPYGFENALIEKASPDALPEAIPVPGLGTDISASGLSVDKLTAIDIRDLSVAAGQLKATIDFPADCSDELELIVLQLTDIWYVQPKSSGSRLAGQPLPEAGVPTSIKCRVQDLDSSTMLVIARKGHRLLFDSTIHPAELDRYFRDGIFLVGVTGNGERYRALSF